MKQWFEEWFDTPFYHTLYKSRNYQEAQAFIDNLGTFLDFQPSDKILDLACGKGRHSKYLNAKGLDVVGLDLSANNIAFANTFANDKLHFHIHDMRNVFCDGCFDYVLNLFTSFGYFASEEENARCIAAMAHNLKVGGTLVLDYMNSQKAIEHLVKYYEKEVDGIKFIITKELSEGFIIKNIDFEFEKKPYHFQERVKAISFDEFMAYFEKAGFICKHIFGNYHLEAFDEINSDRMIFVVEKKI